MFKIVERERVNPVVNKFVIESPIIAKKREPGQFVIFRLHEKGERIPITIADADPKAGTITVYVQELGKTTFEMGKMNAGDEIADVVGPLGLPTPIEKVEGDIFAVAGGVGSAEVLPIARKHKEVGNKVVAILGYRSKDIVILEEEFKSFADEVYITTDDGSYGREGFVTHELKDHLDKGRKIAEVIAVGPAIMMKVVSDLTRHYDVKTMVSLNSIMIDGTGMCGVCRVEVGGETRYACVHGPEFDGHKVNFDLMLKRLASFKEEEKISLDRYNAAVGGENG
ncbi:sulfide/dihydroorotate dehydrogenase-like FAD/NAD-binding protein [candidate division WOR-3 bacterium]|uniref:Sulfide/dihydroorotate dehydrogenase-like FAD/NAD-binding protein n=1 Tax=candidate division WOR-3 bacterium TaxID=2052148 RepID=A0A9D5QE52_UNCW3|nr:sulfide/dihydroorotate dehydrogenase-like FAD/NAD-binding protein [candidate division WOR-3 bacterium]MBD3364710.1 sulfide/dihydroorotate dehydrogenase-like FAD/NAD-binding protein [candidate division WOR-3 bacterium]